MKNPAYLLPPAAALAAALFWMGAQQSEISRLTGQNAEFRQRIAAHQQLLARHEHNEQAPTRQAAVDARTDWEKLSAELLSMRHGSSKMRATLALQQRFLKMSDAELLAACNEVATLDQPGRDLLEGMLFDALAKKNPAMALELFKDRLRDSVRHENLHILVSRALAGLAETDPSSAIAWLDGRIRDGSLDSRALDGSNPVRDSLESSLINAIADSMPGLAGERIAALPANQRGEIIQRLLSRHASEERLALVAGFVNEHTNGADRLELLKNASPSLLGGEDFSKIDRFMELTSATEAERLAIAEKAAHRRMTHLNYGEGASMENISSLRTWIARHAPGEVDRITGSTLAHVRDSGALEGRIGLVLEYHENGGGDALLEGFLGSGAAKSNPELVMPLLDRVSDDALREKLRSQLSP